MKYAYLSSIALFLCLSVSSLFFSKTVIAQNTITLSMSPASKSVSVNETFDVEVIVNTGGQASVGVDSDISFDNTKINLIDIIPGTIFDQYIGEAINNSNGRATISGIVSSAARTFTGTGTVATFRFRAIDTGTASVSFDFISGNTNDANVAILNVEGDPLDSVSNGTYTITSSGSTTTTTTTSSNTTTTSNGTTSTNQMPTSGNSLPALIIAIIGGFFVWLGTLFGKEA